VTGRVRDRCNRGKKTRDGSHASGLEWGFAVIDNVLIASKSSKFKVQACRPSQGHKGAVEWTGHH
jgi:hypothetical protein